MEHGRLEYLYFEEVKSRISQRQEEQEEWEDHINGCETFSSVQSIILFFYYILFLLELLITTQKCRVQEYINEVDLFQDLLGKI